MSYNSKYTGEQVESLLDQIASGIIDTEMSDTSTNAVQNMVIKAYVDGLVGDIASAIDSINGEEV